MQTLSKLVRQALLFIIRVYQCAVSPLLPRRCRYYPTCSTYAFEAIDTYGFVNGCWLTVKRLLRCHPWCDGGVDNVPPLKKKR